MTHHSSTDQEKIRSSISSSLLRFALFRGTLLAGAGAAILLASGAFLPAALLKFWGLPLFLFSFGLIAWGLIPYRRLKRLETTPYILIADAEWIHYFAKGRLQLSVPCKSIKEMSWVDGVEKGFWNVPQKPYGITITLNQQDSVLFFPYFTLASFKALHTTFGA